MALKDVGNKVPIYKLKTTEEVMKYYDEWGKKNKYDKDMVDWNYTGPKETVDTFKKYASDKKVKIFDAGCGTGLVAIELKKYGYSNIDGADLSQKLLDLVPKGYYNKLEQVDLILKILFLLFLQQLHSYILILKSQDEYLYLSYRQHYKNHLQ